MNRGRVITDEERRRGYASHALDVGPHRRWIRRTVSRLRNDGPLGDDLAEAPGRIVVRAAVVTALDQVIRLAALEVVATPFAESFPARRRLAVLRSIVKAYQADDSLDAIADRLFSKETSI
jgi:hypothetical protein